MSINIKAPAFGVTGDGITDECAAFCLADAHNTSVRLPSGDYLIGGDLTIKSPLVASRGCVFHVGDGVTLRLDGGIAAPPFRLFECTGTGRVIFNQAKQRVGFPEWWGAVPNSLADCLQAIDACIKAVPHTQLQVADYRISDTLNILSYGRRLSGQGYGYTASNFGTRIIIDDAQATGIRIGPEIAPLSGIADYTYGVQLNDFALVRSGPPNAAATGIAIQNAAFTRVHTVDVWENCVGFLISGTVQTHITETYAARTLAGPTPEADYFDGYLFDGASGMAAAGGNASVYVTDCVTGCGVPALSASGSHGFLFTGAGADVFLLRPESTGCAQGIQVIGSAGTAKAQSGDADIHITDAVVDAFSQWGIYLTNLSEYAAVDVKGGYFAPAGGASATACIGVTNSGGTVMLTNNQGVGWPTPVMGLYVENSSGVQARSNTYLGCAGGSQFIGASDCTFEDVYNNPSQSATYAIYMRDCTRNYVRPTVKGGGSIFGYGVLLDGAGNSHNEINCTGINPNALVAGSAHKLLINGASISSPGVHSTNLASGVMT